MSRIGEFFNPFSGEYMGMAAYVVRVAEMAALTIAFAAAASSVECMTVPAFVIGVISLLATIWQFSVAPDFTPPDKRSRFQRNILGH